jgi:hypothetical protein
MLQPPPLGAQLFWLEPADFDDEAEANVESFSSAFELPQLGQINSGFREALKNNFSKTCPHSIHSNSYNGIFNCSLEYLQF